MRRYRLITGLGRSGSKWLATQLDRPPLNEVYAVKHEPWALTDYAITQAWMRGGRHNTMDFLSNVRKRWDRMQNAFGPAGLIEVSPCARYLADAIHFTVPDEIYAQVFHLVRDGREQVRSMMARGHYRPDRPSPPGELPIEEGPNRLATMSRLWADGVRACRGWTTVKLDALLYDAMARSWLLETIGIPFTVKSEILRSWDSKTPINATKKHAMPPFAEWSEEDQGTFWSHASVEMALFGWER